MDNSINRRDVLKGSAVLAAGSMFASYVRAEAPPAEAITPQLIEAAKKEGKVVWYTSIDLSVSEKIGAAFKGKFGIDVRAERTGAERVFQRIGQEYASNVHAVDVANSSDAAHLLAWKRQGILQPYLPEDVAKYYKPEHRDADGTWAAFRATLSPVAYNTKLVKPEEAPKSFKDLLDPKWKGKIAEHLSVYQTFPELWEREAFEEKLDGAPEATGEPGKSSAGELGRLAVRVFFSAGGGLLAWAPMPVEPAK